MRLVYVFFYKPYSDNLRNSWGVGAELGTILLAILRVRGRTGRNGFKVHCRTILGVEFSTWRQPSRPSIPRNLKVAKRARLEHHHGCLDVM